MNEKLKSGWRRVENIELKGENAGYQYFLFSPQCFQMSSFPQSFADDKTNVNEKLKSG